MTPRLIFNSFLPKLLKVEAITLYPFIFFANSKEYELKYHVVNHEYVHVLQIQSLGWLKFYYTYLKQYFTLRLKGKSADDAYYGVSYEQEAYAKQEKQVLPEGLV